MLVCGLKGLLLPILLCHETSCLHHGVIIRQTVVDIFTFLWNLWIFLSSFPTFLAFFTSHAHVRSEVRHAPS